MLDVKRIKRLAFGAAEREQRKSKTFITTATAPPRVLAGFYRARRKLCSVFALVRRRIGACARIVLTFSLNGLPPLRSMAPVLTRDERTRGWHKSAVVWRVGCSPAFAISNGIRARVSCVNLRLI